MNITKRITAVILALMLLLCSSLTVSAASGSLSNFISVNSYSDGTFEDVPSGKWFSDNVAKVYECGLMTGVSKTKFAPVKNITLAEVITVAARIHTGYYYGDYEFEPSKPWYRVYAEYLFDNGIIAESEKYSIDSGALTEYAERGEVAEILAHALPEAEFEEINSVSMAQIPDLSERASYADEVLRFYRAGIVQGVDSNYNYNPGAYITRAEAAAIVSRMIDKSLRKRFEIKIKNDEDYIYYYLRNTMNLTKLTACAVMGNMRQESSLNPKAHNTSGGYYGLIQWGGDRKENLQTYCSSNGYDYTTVKGQMAFFNYEVYRDGSYYKQFMDQIQALDDVYENLDTATEIFMRKVEGTNHSLSKRQDFARKEWKKY